MSYDDDQSPRRPILRLVGGTDVVGDRGGAEPAWSVPRPPQAPTVSLMITRRQKEQLRTLGFTDEAIREMTPAEAHVHLGL